MKALLRKLAEASGPSGYESRVREIIRQEVEPFAIETKVDAMGNLILRIGEKSGNGIRILVAAHMDEIGVIASHIEKNGLVRFSNIGTLLPRYLAGSRVKFLDGARGVVDSDLTDDLSHIQHIEHFFIDVGASSDKDCPVRVGDLGVFEREFLDMGNYVVSKALDDRSTCAIMVEVIKQIKNSPNELYFIFSTQEEVGSRGAQTAAFDLDVDLGIALDVTPVGNILGKKMQVHLGKGPAIKVRDMGMISDPRVVKWMSAAATSQKIPHQMEVLQIGTTDAMKLQVSKAGMMAGAVSLPCRYVHSPSEMIYMTDYENMIKLVVTLLNNPVVLK